MLLLCNSSDIAVDHARFVDDWLLEDSFKHQWSVAAKKTIKDQDVVFTLTIRTSTIFTISTRDDNEMSYALDDDQRVERLKTFIAEYV